MKPCLPSSASAAPLKPSRAKVAAVNPAIAAQPTWNRFVHAPLARNCKLPADWLSAMPSAEAMASPDRPNTRPAAAAAPNAPHVAVGWKPRL